MTTKKQRLADIKSTAVGKREHAAEIAASKLLAQDNERLERALEHSLKSKGRVLATNIIQPKRSTKTTQREATFVAVASDWHVGELVEPSKVQGLNRYNPRIAEFRSARFFAAIEELIRGHQKTRFNIRNLVIVLNGDMITGWIHEELMNSNPSGPIRESLAFESMFSAGLKFLGEHLDGVKISVVCQIGNHGRFTPKTMVSMAAHCSFEWLSYHHLAARHPECKWQIEDGRHSIASIYGLRLHVHHGDTVKSGGGVGGILVPINRAVLNWHSKYQAHHTIIGHFHQLMQTPKVTVNGCLIGYGSYADSLPSAMPEPAQQASFLIDAKRGICQSTPLWVSDPSGEKKLP